MPDARMVQVSCATQEEAAAIGRALVRRHLAACIHIVPHTSLYRWQGKIETAPEWMLSVQTIAERQAQVMEMIRDLHSYDLPAIISVVVEAEEHTFRWLTAAADGIPDPNE